MTTVGTSTSAFFDRARLGIADLRKQAEALQAQIGSGQKLSRSSDDPLAASRLRSLSRAGTLSGIDRANANRASSDLKLADSALSNIAESIFRARELAAQAANGVLTGNQRAGIAAELQQLHGNLLTLANSRDAAGHALFGGASAGQAYELDPLGNAVYIGTADAGELPLGEGQSVKRGITGPEFLNFNANGVPTNLMAVIKGLGDALGGAAPDPAQAARDALDALELGLDKVTTGQTLVGARLAWIEVTDERRIDLSELRSGEEADLGSPDLAATVTQLQQIMLALEASQASFVKLSSLSLFDQLR